MIFIELTDCYGAKASLKWVNKKSILNIFSLRIIGFSIFLYEAIGKVYERGIQSKVGSIISVYFYKKPRDIRLLENKNENTVTQAHGSYSSFVEGVTLRLGKQVPLSKVGSIFFGKRHLGPGSNVGCDSNWSTVLIY